MSPYAESYGPRGCKVRVYEPREGDNLMMARFVDGKYHSASLGHRDRERAKQEAHDLIADVLSGRQASTAEPSKLTVKELILLNIESEKFGKLKPKQQAEKRSLLLKIAEYFGPTKLVIALDDDAIAGLLNARRKGKKPFEKKCGPQAVYACYAALRSVIRWGCRKKNANGRFILTHNPLEGMAEELEIRPNKTPLQPIIAHEDFETIRRAAGSAKLPYYVRVFLILAEASGRRRDAIRCLTWDDISFNRREIFWQADADKEGYQMERAASRRALRYLKVWKRHCPSDQWVFPAPEDPTQCVSKVTTDKWPGQLYRAAGLKKPHRGGWHMFRRKWATERDSYPLATLKAAGGWSSTEALMRYLKTDRDQIATVVLNPTRRVTAPKLERELEQVENPAKKVRFKSA